MGEPARSVLTAAVLGYLSRIPRPGWTWPAEDAPDPREPQEHAVDLDGDHAPDAPASDPRSPRV